MGRNNQSIVKGNVHSYGNKKQKTSYGNGGFGSQPTVGYSHISDEAWEQAFGKKEEKEDDKI
jgi:hypothetical protein